MTWPVLIGPRALAVIVWFQSAVSDLSLSIYLPIETVLQLRIELVVAVVVNTSYYVPCVHTLCK